MKNRLIEYLLIAMLFLGGCAMFNKTNKTDLPPTPVNAELFEALPDSMKPEAKSKALDDIKNGDIGAAIEAIVKSTKKDVKKDRSVAQKSMDWILIILVPICVLVTVAAIPIAIWIDRKWGVKAGITGVASLAVLGALSMLFPAFILIGKIIAGVLVTVVIGMLLYALYKFAKNKVFIDKVNGVLIEGQSATMHLTGQKALDELSLIQDEEVEDYVKSKLYDSV